MACCLAQRPHGEVACRGGHRLEIPRDQNVERSGVSKRMHMHLSRGGVRLLSKQIAACTVGRLRQEVSAQSQEIFRSYKVSKGLNAHGHGHGHSQTRMEHSCLRGALGWAFGAPHSQKRKSTARRTPQSQGHSGHIKASTGGRRGPPHPWRTAAARTSRPMNEENWHTYERMHTPMNACTHLTKLLL
jgi:hypothetical protein